MALKSQLSLTFSLVRKTVIFIAGGIILLAGIAMIVTPGPSMLVIPAGLSLLAIEFDWAKGMLLKVRQWCDNFRTYVRRDKPTNVDLCERTLYI